MSPPLPFIDMPTLDLQNEEQTVASSDGCLRDTRSFSRAVEDERRRPKQATAFKQCYSIVL